MNSHGHYSLISPELAEAQRGGSELRIWEVEASHLTIEHTLGTQIDFLRNGWSSWAPSTWWNTGRAPWRVWNNPARTLTAEDLATDNSSIHQSYMMTCLRLPGDSDTVLLIGRLDPASAIIEFSLGAVSAHDIDGDSSSAHWLLCIGAELEALNYYGAELARRFPPAARRPKTREKILSGPRWSSWYSWFEEITEQGLAAEIEPAADSGYQVFQIDDGWERSIGEWEPNGKFAHGMAHLAQRIRACGMEAGIWLAPFIASAHAPIVAQHPEYFIHDEQGNLARAGFNWGEYYFALDCTIPEVRAYIASVISEVLSWGFTYFKLDFLNAAAIRGNRREAMPREAAYRTGLAVIREAAPEAYINASGAVLAPSLGLVDALRVGADTAPYWDNTDRDRDPSGPSMRGALRNSLARLWLKNAVAIDPDVAYVRTHGSLLSPEANAVTQDLARVCGTFSCSDPNSWLMPEQRAQVAELCAEFRKEQPPTVRQLSRYRFIVGRKDVDFEPWINPQGRISDRLLVK
ncbi:MAG: glycoside hydrolase family 36 protein [Arcanobacterium sp.]|nr:glycoside hydrolase family 36 protein [Arcanobacterium sp.]